MVSLRPILTNALTLFRKELRSEGAIALPTNQRNLLKAVMLLFQAQASTTIKQIDLISKELATVLGKDWMTLFLAIKTYSFLKAASGAWSLLNYL